MIFPDFLVSTTLQPSLWLQWDTLTLTALFPYAKSLSSTFHKGEKKKGFQVSHEVLSLNCTGLLLHATNYNMEQDETFFF